MINNVNVVSSPSPRDSPIMLVMAGASMYKEVYFPRHSRLKLIHNLQAVAKYAEQHDYTSKQGSAKVEVKQDKFHYGGCDEEKHAKDFAEVEQKSAEKQDKDEVKFEGSWDKVETSGKYNARSPSQLPDARYCHLTF